MQRTWTDQLLEIAESAASGKVNGSSRLTRGRTADRLNCKAKLKLKYALDRDYPAKYQWNRYRTIGTATTAEKEKRTLCSAEYTDQLLSGTNESVAQPHGTTERKFLARSPNGTRGAHPVELKAIRPIVAASTVKATKRTPIDGATRFRPPVTVLKQPVVKLRNLDVSPKTPMDFREDTLDNRIDYIRSHFLNKLFADLNASRRTPITKPPYPSALPQQISAVCSSLAFQGFHPDLYLSSLHEVAVALRFWLCRLHVFLQLGSGQAWSADSAGTGMLGPDLSRWPVVMACRQITGSIWYVETGSESASEHSVVQPTSILARSLSIGIDRFIILEPSGEVIGRSPKVSAKDEADGRAQQLLHGCEIRSDWREYLEGEFQSHGLLSYVKTKDDHTYPGRISRAWRSKTKDKEQLDIAERAVYASCASESLTGPKYTSTQLDAQWLGNRVNDGSTSTKIELYLPEPHQVASVYLPNAPFHPSLAVVTRQSGISDYVIRETGQSVGNEDEGVTPLWQGVLRCDEKGTEMKRSEGFWTGWEDRLKGIT